MPQKKTSSKTKTRCIGILTAGGDCPGLNAAIRGVAKAAMHNGIKVVGIRNGFRGLVENNFVTIDSSMVAGILTLGGTILGSARDKPHKMKMGGEILDMTKVAIENARRMQIDCLVALGGNGTQKNALHLHNTGGLPVITLPKTIDNDVYGTDVSFGFDTALDIATSAIDRLHTTALSHHRIIVCELMGHQAGWLALGAGMAGGADVILIPEIPYDLDAVAEHLVNRRRSGRRFSIIALAEGALSLQEHETLRKESKSGKKSKKKKKSDELVKDANGDGHFMREPTANRIARLLEERTGIEARVTSLGHVQRGGSPSAADRVLCTRLGCKAGELLVEGHYNVMVALKNNACEPVPLEKIAGKLKTVPPDHEWIRTARYVETCFGDRPQK